MDFELRELLRTIIRKASDAEQIHRLAKRIRDWDSVLLLAWEHRILPMLYSRLAGSGSAVPLIVQERLRTEYERNLFHNMANAAELLAVLKAFEDESIPAMPFKGVVLGAVAYHDLTARTAGDLDILIHIHDLIRAMTILVERGYERITAANVDGTPIPGCYEYRFERQVDGMVLELRWRLALTEPRYGRNLGLDWVWSRRRTATLAGAEVPDIDPELTLFILCMHGSRHFWSRLLWICDVAQLIESSPELDWEEIISEAKKQGLWRSLALGVLFAHRIVGATVAQSVLWRFESDAVACKVAQHIEDHLFDVPGSSPPGFVPYNFQLLDFNDRVRAILSFDFLKPNDRDRAALSLPKPLHFLYYLIRPFRLLSDRSAR